MTTTEERLEDLEMRVAHLETWAGPGQAEALSNGLGALRAETASFRREVNHRLGRLETDVATLKTDVAQLKTDMATVQSGVQELLRRVPPAA
jgi:uncharacterized coiled-coil protein SlyX